MPGKSVGSRGRRRKASLTKNRTWAAANPNHCTTREHQGFVPGLLLLNPAPPCHPLCATLVPTPGPNEVGQRPTEFCQENPLVIANTLFQQHKRRLYIWTSPDGQYQNQIGYIFCSQRWRSFIPSAKTRLGADSGSGHEFLITKFRLKLKKVGKTTRPFRYDLNQIPYDYTVEVTNRFKGLDLIECLKNYGRRFMTLYRRQ